MHPNQQEIVQTLESDKSKHMAVFLVNSDNTLTQLHVCLSILYCGIEDGLSMTEMKDALYTAIKIRRD